VGGTLRSDGFVRDSIRAVVQTLLEAVVLVVLVVILFLQTWRASIIPLIAVPVSVVGTFSILYLLGFSLNTLSLFGLVLAIGMWWTTPSWWWKTSSEISKRACSACGGASGDA
jgi:multidrug efflux pump subunit AcrB